MRSAVVPDATRNKKLLRAPGLATRSKDATRLEAEMPSTHCAVMACRTDME